MFACTSNESHKCGHREISKMHHAYRLIVIVYGVWGRGGGTKASHVCRALAQVGRVTHPYPTVP